LLRLIPDTDVQVIERCSGHGGSWGIKRENFDVAIKVGRPVARAAAEQKKRHVVSECPLAGLHILQGMERIEGNAVPDTAPHPIQIIAQAYGV
jgi:glycerol-3-phosphate dehydrogenase subunit C